MQPNKLGGQTFDDLEIGVINNALYQAYGMLNFVPAESANSGHSPAYRELEKLISPFPGVEHNSLLERVKELQEKVRSTDEPTLAATISEAQVYMACVKWLTSPDALIQPNITSESQLDKAKQMVADFENATASSAAS